MSNRLDKEREKRLQPVRMERAIEALRKKGYDAVAVSETEVHFMYDGSLVKLWPYSGWHTGKSIVDDRGLIKLLRQLESK